MSSTTIIAKAFDELGVRGTLGKLAAFLAALLEAAPLDGSAPVAAA